MVRVLLSKTVVETDPNLMWELTLLSEDISLSSESAIIIPKSGFVTDLAMLLKEKDIPYDLDIQES